MSRKSFLTVVSIIALGVGWFALLAPATLLASKGVAPSEAADVWVREVGIAIVAIGVATFLVRDHGDSPTLRAFLVGNAILQMGLFPIELVAYAHGVITRASGVVPNSVLHVFLAGGFAYFAARVRPGTASGTASG
jgi:hypothetical protein